MDSGFTARLQGGGSFAAPGIAPSPGVFRSGGGVAHPGCGGFAAAAGGAPWGIWTGKCPGATGGDQ